MVEEEEELLLPRSPSPRPSVPPAPTQEGNEDKMGHGQERGKSGEGIPSFDFATFFKETEGEGERGPFYAEVG